MKSIASVCVALYFATMVFNPLTLVAQCNHESAPQTAAGCCSAGAGWQSQRADGVAPIGVMGDHTHRKGGLMFSYQFMNMPMEGIQAGKNSVTEAAVLADYMQVPQRMDMQMHMLGVMYGLTDHITLMAMTNYMTTDMSQLMRAGMHHQHATSGLGDTRLSMIAGVFSRKRQKINLNVGVGVPTGSIHASQMMHMSGDHAMPMEMRLPYRMQTGTGTLDLDLGATYLGQADRFSWGAQSTVRTATNDKRAGYRWGNRYQLNLWGAWQTSCAVSLSLRTQATAQQSVIGKDATLQPMLSPAADVANTGGQHMLAYVGVNTYLPGTLLQGLRLGAEFGMPCYQNTTGIQLSMAPTFTAGLRYGWHRSAK